MAREKAMTLENEVIAPMFKMVGTDYARAVRRSDCRQQRKLGFLVVALEEAYPDEMRELRDSPLMKNIVIPS